MIKIIETTDISLLPQLIKDIGIEIRYQSNVRRMWIAEQDGERVGGAGLSRFDKYWILDFLTIKEGINNPKEVCLSLLDSFIKYVKKKKITPIYTLMGGDNERASCKEVGFKEILMKELPEEYKLNSTCWVCKKREKICWPAAMVLQL